MEFIMKFVFSLVAIFAISVSVCAAQTKVTKESVPGITNFARVETTIACAGAIKPESVAEIKKMGFASIVNLRLATEEGANVDAEQAAAKAAGINYVHLPLNNASPDTAVVDRFLKTVTEPGNQPAFIHCASGNRAAVLWFIKRTVVDKWDMDRALSEATQLGYNPQPTLKTFALNYIETHKK
jgi:uncharacterized protein (TIGR01244 family)